MAYMRSKWLRCLTQRSCFWVALSWVELCWVLTTISAVRRRTKITTKKSYKKTMITTKTRTTSPRPKTGVWQYFSHCLPNFDLIRTRSKDHGQQQQQNKWKKSITKKIQQKKQGQKLQIYPLLLIWFGPKRDLMQNFWRDRICSFEWTRPLIGYPWLATPDTCPWYLPPIPAPDSRPRYVELIAVPDTCPRILPPIPWVNQKPSSFKAVDRVPPEILHDISLLKLGFWINKTIIKTTTAKQKQNQQQYFSYCLPNFDQTLKLGFCE